MATASDAPVARPIASVGELVAGFHAASKPRAAWRVGAEHEKLGVVLDPAAGTPGAALPYAGERGIAAILGALAQEGWAPVREGDHVIALTQAAASVTLEPGGQLELSGSPAARLADVVTELRRHREQLLGISARLGIGWLALGFRPLGTLDEVPWMPKGRYAVMRAYLPTRGHLAHEMMKRTATVQANLDWSDEDDAARKYRAAMSVTSIVTALWANSPLVDGKDSGYASYRARIWLDTDPDRCGIPTVGFDGRPLFGAYTEWALDVPMFFVHREAWGGYAPAEGLSFRRFLAEGFRGERATVADWQLHLSTLFPETRLKSYMEMRGADAGSTAMVEALPALWKGVLYDDDACAAAAALTAHLGHDERLALRAAVPRTGLATPLRARGGGTVTLLELGRELVATARAGLGRLAPDEVPLLAAVEDVAASGHAPADRVREVFRAHGPDVRALHAAFGL